MNETFPTARDIVESIIGSERLTEITDVFHDDYGDEEPSAAMITEGLDMRAYVVHVEQVRNGQIPLKDSVVFAMNGGYSLLITGNDLSTMLDITKAPEVTK